MDLSGGPYLQTACLCERVLEEKDGVLSAIRIVDRIGIQAQFAPGQPAPAMPAIPVSLWVLISFKAGRARGSYSVRIEPRTPAGLKMPGPTVPVLLEGDDDRGVNLKLNLNFVAQEQGTYWFDVLFEDQLVTRMPLRVIYQPMTMSLPPQL